MQTDCLRRRDEYGMSNADPESLRAAATDLVALCADAIFAPGLSFVVTRTDSDASNDSTWCSGAPCASFE